MDLQNQCGNVGITATLLYFFFDLDLGLPFADGAAVASRASRSAFKRSRFCEKAVWASS